MNKKGFTLVELIAIIIIISLVSLLSFTSLTNMLKDSNNREKSTFESSLKVAAQVYVETNKDDFPNLSTIGTVRVSASTLVEKGYLKPNTNNPTEYEFTNIYVKVIKESDNSLTYTVEYR